MASVRPKIYVPEEHTIKNQQWSVKELRDVIIEYVIIKHKYIKKIVHNCGYYISVVPKI